MSLPAGAIRVKSSSSPSFALVNEIEVNNLQVLNQIPTPAPSSVSEGPASYIVTSSEDEEYSEDARKVASASPPIPPPLYSEVRI